MPAKAEVIGADRLARTTRAAGADMDDMSTELAPAGRIIADYARTIVPRVSGQLAATIRYEGDKRSVKVLAGSAVVVYAGVIHNGWAAHNIAANPFVTRAAEATAPQWESAATDQVQSDLNHIKGK